MFKIISFSLMLLSCAQAGVNKPTNQNVMTAIAEKTSIHSFTVDGLMGDKLNFADFKGKKILIVNTASRCGYTPQYKDLEDLHNKYKDKLVVIGFPANNFGGQEPGTNDEINTFCKKNYGVSFTMAAKVSVKGDDQAAIYTWLCNKSKNGVLDAEVKWNFGKFLLDENGYLIEYFASGVNPLDAEITNKL
jgi:glutathione peroxidase